MFGRGGFHGGGFRGDRFGDGFRGGRLDGRHHRFSNNVIFFDDGFPGWWDWGYPYGYYGYGYYPYSYYPYGYYPYGYGGYGYYGDPGYGYRYGSRSRNFRRR
jgi:hypothetical protein